MKAKVLYKSLLSFYLSIIIEVPPLTFAIATDTPFSFDSILPNPYIVVEFNYGEKFPIIIFRKYIKII